MHFPEWPDWKRVQRLTPPDGKVSLVLDTDTYNEIDDQFALVHALLSPERLSLEAVYAAPFWNKRSENPGDGMEKSYEEILRLLDLLNHSQDGYVFRGSTQYLKDECTPVESEAAQDLITKARQSRKTPLYVAAIGAATNVASALLLAPDIAEKIVVLWLGGHPTHFHHNQEFNLRQDPAAARVLLDCGAPFIRIPCRGVAEHLRTTVAEMALYLQGKNPLADYLFQIFADYEPDGALAWSKVIWDVAVIAWLLNPDWVPTVLQPSPLLTQELTWSHKGSRPLMREAQYSKRDAIFQDLFRKIQSFSSSR